MGDRVWAQVTFKKDYLPLVEKVESLGASEAYNNKDLVEIEDDQANYGEMEWVTKYLDDLKIPYDLRWAQGYGFGEGEKYVRFDSEGVAQVTEVYDSTCGTIYISSLLKLIKDNPTMSIQGIKQYLEEENKKYEIYEDQNDLATIPLRELTEEESALIMKFKMEDKGGV